MQLSAINHFMFSEKNVALESCALK